MGVGGPWCSVGVGYIVVIVENRVRGGNWKVSFRFDDGHLLRQSWPSLTYIHDTTITQHYLHELDLLQ